MNNESNYLGNILIVDDLPENIRLLSDILNEQGYQVRGVVKGSIVLNVAKSGWAELILLDINMPEMDGYQVCQHLQADPQTASIPVIFLSASNDLLDKVKAFRVGGVDYIIKPFQVEEVLARVTTHLKLCKLQNTLEQEVEARTLQLTLALQEADSANLAKSNFMANMSHELLTPLNAVIGYSEILKEEATEIGQEALFLPDLEKIHSAAHNLLGIIHNVLNLSKIDTDKIELNLETVTIFSIIEEVFATSKPLIYKSANTLVVNLPESDFDVYVDVFKVRSGLLNLLNNANKFTKKGIIILTVSSCRDGDRDFVSFRVTDTGIGIAPEHIKQLFKPFSQVDDSSTRKYGGVGLGLVLTEKFCRTMGGKIEVESEVGMGSHFTIKLPITVKPLN
jgi:two-component system, sensor histidine kinase and response regulator